MLGLTPPIADTTTADMRILTAAQMREADRRTIEEIGLPSRVLMENAGREVAAVLSATFDDLTDSSVAIVCGRGNNGGDGLVVARVLHDKGVDVTVFLVGRVADVQGDARANLESLARLGGSVVEILDAQAWDLHVTEISASDLIVDALFGTGLRDPLQGMLETVVADMNATGLPIVSVDLPSGLSADVHDVVGPTVQATVTVTLGAPKLPLILPPAERWAGELVVADIGIPQQIIDGLDGPRLELLTRDALRRLLQPRPADVHKGDMGRVLLVAGSPGTTGAARLAAMAALRSGCGLVTLATPRSCQAILASMAPEYLTLGLAETTDGALDAAATDESLQTPADVLAVGPGLGTAPETIQLVRDLVARRTCPLVLDADGLNAFIDDPGALQGSDGPDLVITPHPGEMARLVGATSTEVQANRVEVAGTFATTHEVIVVLKGHRTLVATPDGRVYVNPTGNPGMATGGTGDVLTGMIAAWIAQLLDAEAACRLSAYLHGLAGDLAEADEGEVALIASDLVDRLGDAVLELAAERRVDPD